MFVMWLNLVASASMVYHIRWSRYCVTHPSCSWRSTFDCQLVSNCTRGYFSEMMSQICFLYSHSLRWLVNAWMIFSRYVSVVLAVLFDASRAVEAEVAAVACSTELAFEGGGKP